MAEQKSPTKQTEHEKAEHANKKANTRMVMYIIAAVVVIAIVGLAYFILTSNGFESTKSGYTPTTTIPQVYNTSQRVLFYSDLANASNISDLYVSYTTLGNFTQEVAGPSNTTLLEIGSQDIQSYEMGNSIRSTLYNDVTYRNITNGAITSMNTTVISYYNLPNDTITCLNQSTYVPSGIMNSSISCIMGDGGLDYLGVFPFTLDNQTSMEGIGDYNITYLGTGEIDGRSCSAFATTLPAQAPFANYSTVSLCLDSKYGIPTYFNDSDVTNGVASSVQSLLAVNVSSNVNASEFVIPSSYIADAASGTGK